MQSVHGWGLGKMPLYNWWAPSLSVGTGWQALDGEHWVVSTGWWALDGGHWVVGTGWWESATRKEQPGNPGWLSPLSASLLDGLHAFPTSLDHKSPTGYLEGDESSWQSLYHELKPQFQRRLENQLSSIFSFCSLVLPHKAEDSIRMIRCWVLLKLIKMLKTLNGSYSNSSPNSILMTQ